MTNVITLVLLTLTMTTQWTTRNATTDVVTSSLNVMTKAHIVFHRLHLVFYLLASLANLLPVPPPLVPCPRSYPINLARTMNIPCPSQTSAKPSAMLAS